MKTRDRRLSDNGDDSGYKQRRFFNNGTVYKMLFAMIMAGSGYTGKPYFYCCVKVYPV